MIEIATFKEPEQDYIEPIANVKFSITNSIWNLESHDPITGELVLERHSGNIYCWVNNEWVQLCSAPEEEYIIEPV